MTQAEFDKLTELLDREVLGNHMHGGEAAEVIVELEDVAQRDGLIAEIWHPIDEKADGTKFVVLYDVEVGYMSPASRCAFGFDSMFINAMNKKYGANYTMWAYKDDLAPKR